MPKPGTRKNMLAQDFCRCIKKVRRTVKLRPGQPKISKTKQKEGAAIAICVKSVLQTRGKTLKRFRCKKGAKLQTQTMKRKQTGGAVLVGSLVPVPVSVSAVAMNVNKTKMNSNPGFLNQIASMF